MSVGGASVGREGKEVVSTLIGTQNLVLTTQIHYYLYNC